MYLNKLMRVAILGGISMLASTASYAADRCNTKFTFHNKFSFPITIEDHRALYIMGNRGEYIESFDKNLVVSPNGRKSTRSNRLQKVDDRTRADFYIRNVRSQYGRLGFHQEFRQEVGIDNRNILCRDRKFITLTLKPLPDTPANRNRVIAAAGPNASAADKWRLLARYMDVFPP